MKNKQVVLSSYTNELINESNLQVVESEIEPEVVKGSRDVLIKNVWISVDPWGRLCMHGSDQGLHLPQFELHKPVPCLVIGQIISSDNAKYQTGEFVTGVGTTSEYTLLERGESPYGELARIDSNLTTPLHYHLGLLGMPAFTAWIALVRLAQVKPGEQVFVSAALGGVGIAAGQIAKLKGCRVVGSAGSDDKVKILKERFGYDEAFNYKTSRDWSSVLAQLFQNGIDVYVDNVGGEMLESVLNNINHHARIAISGMISQYNTGWKDAYGVRNLMSLVGRCAKMEGFITLDHMEYFKDFINEMVPAIQQGKIVSTETITKGIETYPSALVGIMKGNNVGKHLIQL